MKEVRLNKAQQDAVDHIFGPLLVLAGPGTGKTQLLSARIANILKKTDTSASNILCLTFTDNAANNMRERLSKIIGSLAYDIHIGTYHSFGSDIIRAYPDYFETINLETGEDTRLERPIDELEQFQIITQILDTLPFSSPLIGARHYPKQIISVIADLKKASLSPATLKKIAEDNMDQHTRFTPMVQELFSGVTRMPTKLNASLAIIEPLLQSLAKSKQGIARIAYEELKESIESAMAQQKTTPITTWKNNWLTKNADGQFEFLSSEQQLRIIELAHIYNLYNETLRKRYLYDFDDMILQVNQALIKYPELKYNLQEKYQFILLDEFQDTNQAQFKLVELLSDNPVLENEPNVFAVGDDDQAIYAFQGAELDNMKKFTEIFSNVTVINLTENYRSHKDIIHVAHNISEQIDKRLHRQLEGIEKTLTAESSNNPELSLIERHEFASVANEYSWVAQRVHELVAQGVPADEIAILSPQHKFLEAIVPFFAQLNVPVSYEKRENILSTPLITMLSTCVELILAISASNYKKMNQLFPIVFSYEYFDIPIGSIWEVNWKLNHEDDVSWDRIAINDPIFIDHVEAFLKLGLSAGKEPLEQMLDYIIGTQPIHLGNGRSYTSPLRAYYFTHQTNNTLEFYEALTHLSTMREHIRGWQRQQDAQLHLSDYLHFINIYKQHDQPLINSHPISQSDSAVQLMTIYKSKGLEFTYVFLLSLDDTTWGKTSRSQSNKLALPRNLTYIRYKGSDEDEIIRLLYVAVTRAKYGLILTSHAMKDNGKQTTPVKYLKEHEEDDSRVSDILPQYSQKIHITELSTPDTLQAVDTLWHSRHLQIEAPLSQLIKDRLTKYRMSPTHLNTFIDVEFGGPKVFLENTLLKFPSAPQDESEYGNAVHAALERFQKNAPTNFEQLKTDFTKQLKKSYIAEDRKQFYIDKGVNSLQKYLGNRIDMFERTAEIEVDFFNEHIVLDGVAKITGKIDRIEIDKNNKTLRIVDFKTGKGYTKWEKEVKLLKYRQQLYFYVLLIENSMRWQGYSITDARLEFIEPATNGITHEPLILHIDENEKQQMKKLILKIWDRIQNLDFPDLEGYDESYKGVEKFIHDLLNEH